MDYGDAFATYGPIGVIVRMGDKIQRLLSVTKKGVTLVDSESLRDTLIDLHNYSAMAIMLIDEEKEKNEKSKKNENFFIDFKDINRYKNKINEQIFCIFTKIMLFIETFASTVVLMPTFISEPIFNNVVSL
jgi:hypothetical protein